MHVGRTVFAQLIDHVPPYEFHKCVERYRGNYKFRADFLASINSSVLRLPS